MEAVVLKSSECQAVVDFNKARARLRRTSQIGPTNQSKEKCDVILPCDHEPCPLALGIYLFAISTAITPQDFSKGRVSMINSCAHIPACEAMSEAMRKRDLKKSQSVTS